jgi:ATP phosphoribosyltransferase
MSEQRIKLAIQKKGRLAEKSIDALRRCGVEVDTYSDRLMVPAKNYPLDLLLLRDDDIPEYVQDGVADLGVVGENVLYEKGADCEVTRRLGFGGCRLMIGIPEDEELEDAAGLRGKRIATSHPNLLTKYLKKNGVEARVVSLSGSVEIAPSLGVADAICDIVSTGNTLKFNKLKKSLVVFESEAALVANRESLNAKREEIDELLDRIDSALASKRTKYLMLNAPKDRLDEILEIVPALDSPTVLNLADDRYVALHAVIPTKTFWEIRRRLQEAGATGIIILPIDNLIV